MVEPQIFLIGETAVHHDGLHDYLTHIGAKGWNSDAPSGAECLTEVMARSCYRSFGTELNPNITRVRKGNRAHLRNLINVGHGSTLEHAWLNFMFCDVSRVVTHELVRHRVGTAISQESLRFVRLDEQSLNCERVYVPLAIRNNPDALAEWEHIIDMLGRYQVDLAEMFDLDSLPFEQKKALTSAMRRLAPIGVATSIGWSANIRAIRHVIEMRTHPSAEEEIRLLFSKVAALCVSRYPHLFGDYRTRDCDGILWYHTDHAKV